MPKYNELCPGHRHYCWSHRHLMREDDLVCTPDYKRLSSELKKRLWDAKDGINSASNLSIVVDWLLENPMQEDTDCREK